jgi:hypothetical protein
MASRLASWSSRSRKPLFPTPHLDRVDQHAHNERSVDAFRRRPICSVWELAQIHETGCFSITLAAVSRWIGQSQEGVGDAERVLARIVGSSEGVLLGCLAGATAEWSAAPMTRYDRNVDEIFLLEDNTNSAEREYLIGVGDGDCGSSITIAVHRLNGTRKTTLVRKTYKSRAQRSKRAARLEMAAALLTQTAGRSPRPIVVAGTSYGTANAFLQMMADQILRYVVQIRPSTTITLLDGKQEIVLTAGKALDHADWKHLKIKMPDECAIECSAAKIGSVSLPLGRGKLFAAQMGGIPGIHRGTIIGVSSFDASPSGAVFRHALAER